MTPPQTLLQMAGVEPRPAALSQAAVVMIDLQAEYVTGALPLSGVEAAIEAAARLLARAREAGAPVIHIAHAGRPGSLFDRSAERGQIVAAVAPAGDEPVVEKPRPNAFSGTSLEERLRATGRRQILVAGFMTHMCVSSTVRAALDLGYGATVVAAACATRDLPTPGGRRARRGGAPCRRAGGLGRPLRGDRPARRRPAGLTGAQTRVRARKSQVRSAAMRALSAWKSARASQLKPWPAG